MTKAAIEVKSCRKCGSEHLSGPRFTRGKQGEHLRWKCWTCGFSWSTQPLDAQQAS